MPSRAARVGRPETSNSVEIRVAYGTQDLTRAVGAEVREEQPVAVLHPLIVAEGGRGEEFVGDVFGMVAAHGIGGAKVASVAPAFDNGAVGALDPIPAVVAVHGKVAAGHGDDAHPRGQRGLELGQLPDGGPRGDVAAVSDGVDDNRHAFSGDDPRGLGHVGMMRVNSARRGEPGDMRRPAGDLQRRDEVAQRGLGGELPVLDGEVDHAQIHRHDAARSDIGMSHLRVAHLPLRQAHVAPMGDERRMRAGRHEAVEGRRAGKGRGVR
jgi:hypothetical protein